MTIEFYDQPGSYIRAGTPTEIKEPILKGMIAKLHQLCPIVIEGSSEN